MAPLLTTSIRRSELSRQIGPGYSDAVVGPFVDDHEPFLGHVALYAKGPLTRSALVNFFVKMVIGAVISIGPVALEAEVVSLLYQLQAVDIVTVTASDIVLKHFALDEGPIHIDFFQNLTIGVVQPLIQKGRHEVVE